jgi:hypothetical protein
VLALCFVVDQLDCLCTATEHSAVAGCRDGDSADESKYTQWFAEYTITNFVQTALQYSGEAVEVNATSMFIGAASCKGLMEYRSNNVIVCPYNLSLGSFPMPLDGISTRFVKNLDWVLVNSKVLLFGGMMEGVGTPMKVCYLPC